MGAELVEEGLEGSIIDRLPFVTSVILLMCVSTGHSLFVQQRRHVAQMFCHAWCLWVLAGSLYCFLAYRLGR